MRSENILTVDEVVALLKKTSLPTVIVEGRDDLIVYKQLERIYFEQNVSVLPVGGRNAVLEIYERSGEIPKSKKVIFIADRDVWVVTGIPQKYESEKIIFTDGYSIENDVFRDGELWSYMCFKERQRFSAELKRFLYWYAIAFDRHLNGKDESFDRHPNHLLNDADEYGKLVLLELDEPFPTKRYDELTVSYPRILRGKSLLALVLRQLSYPGRAAKHTDKTLMEHVAVKPNALIKKTIESVGRFLNTE